MRRGRRKAAVGGAAATVTGVGDKPAGRRTRSQSLKENQEIEILPVDSQTCERSLSNVSQKTELNRPFTREGSHDSAISSNSSKWSVSSSISIMSCQSTRALAKKKASLLNAVEEEQSTRMKGKVSDATLTWVNSISPERIRSAMPVVRSGATTNGHVVRQSVSRSIDGSETDSGCDTKMANDVLFSHYGLEVLIHLSTFISVASTVSTDTYLRSVAKGESTSTNPLLLQIVVYLFIGTVSDLMSPKVALLSTHLAAVGVCLLNYLNPSTVSLAYLPFLNSGYLESQVIAAFCRQICSLEGMLARVGLAYGLASFVCPQIVAVSTQYLGATLNYMVITLASLLSISAGLRLLPSNFRACVYHRPSLRVEFGWLHFLGFVLMKVFLTIPLALLLPLLQGMIQDGSFIEGVSLSTIVTVGLLCVQAAVTPVLLFFTSPATATVTVAALLTLIYPALLIFFEGLSQHQIIVMIPLCGMVSIAQVMILSASINAFPRLKGTVLAVSLTTHIMARYLATQAAGHLSDLCTFSQANLVSLNSSQWAVQIFDFVKFENFLPEFHIEMLSCNNIHLETLALTGCVCSGILVVLGLCLMRH
ncbi:uncharacterized protein LOC122264916 [Penaeus japonicus]|uniref:uncharacterized protein LOC122264916 n=1 Tax=Penaeus japonicus TaxID=27405 RepID=UPI001C716318|nr:uncharacterized protein LOC122264916 [Penaeus japonicus]XP_042889943.1 uncharacterized protein LOC122264916 [Penaeus japonicus]XP_042889944.1 uncharacterized protein LOC122264916 [Penaeus japonicus]